MSAERYRVARLDGDRFAVMLGEETIVIASPRRAYQLARRWNEEQPTPAELEAPQRKRKETRVMRVIRLRHAATCRRCGQRIEAGERARWRPGSVLHPRPCSPPIRGKP